MLQKLGPLVILVFTHFCLILDASENNQTSPFEVVTFKSYGFTNFLKIQDQEDVYTPDFLKDFVLETFVGLIATSVILKFFTGKKKNVAIVHQWHGAIRPQIRERFPSEKIDVKSIAYHYFETFLSGTQGIHGALFRFELIPRQCLWMHSYSYILGDHDTIYLKIILKNTEKMAILIGERHRIKALRKLHEQITEVSCSRYPSTLSPLLFASADDMEALLMVLNTEMTNFLNDHDSHIKYLCISELICTPRFNWPGSLVIEFKARVENLDVLQTYVKTIVDLADRLKSVKLAEKTREHIASSREILEKKQYRAKEIERQEELHQRKLEKILEAPEAKKIKYGERREKKEMRAKQKVIK